jgi:UDP-xylose:glucoside alpha-1,3-xylosyltransferase
MATAFCLLPILYLLLLLLVAVPVNAIESTSATATTVVEALTVGTENNNDNKNERIHIAIVSCGASRAPEALASMRSALLMTQHPLSFHIFHNADDGNDVYFTKALSRWQQQQQQQKPAQSAFDFFLYKSNLSDDYATLFAPCACQRLFLHESLPESVERVLYVDSDTLFLADVGILWKKFEKALQRPMSNILAALVSEHQATSKSAYYRDQTNHPYYHDENSVGLNSGVLLLNLKRLRAHPWNQALTNYLHHENYTLQYYDQDLLNIYFHFHPDELLVLSCDWNFRTDHCFFANQHCSTTISILHGSRGTFHAPTTPTAERFSVGTFQTLHRAFSLFPVTELGSVAAVRDAWLWLTSSSEKKVANHCDLLVPSIVTRILTEAQAASSRKPRLFDKEDEL